MNHIIVKEVFFLFLKFEKSETAFQLLSRKRILLLPGCLLAMFFQRHSRFAILNGIRMFQLQADVPKNAPPIKGFNVILQRMANIMINVTDRQVSKALHIHPISNLLYYAGEVKYPFPAEETLHLNSYFI
jgi:hypothetical protein